MVDVHPRPDGSPLTQRSSSSLTRRSAIAGGLTLTAGLASACTVGGSDEPGTTASGASAEPGAVIALDEVPLGGAAPVTIDRRPAVVARPSEHVVVAFSALCTHRGCQVRVQGATLQCPCHGSRFDALTGAVLRGPATAPLPSIEVHLDGDEVVAG